MILILWAMILITVLCTVVPKWINMLDDVPKEYEKCYGCTCIWCDAVPGDNECERWKEKHERKTEAGSNT